jgi:Fe2+ transport system protein FeoA
MKPLALAQSGERVRIKEIQAGRRFCSRLHAMGLTENTEVEVVSNYGRGPVLIMKDNFRLAIGWGMAQKIMVESVDNGKKEKDL